MLPVILVVGLVLGSLAVAPPGLAGDGEVAWTRQFGSSRYDSAADVAVYGSGVYVTGYVGGALSNQVSAGNTDVFLRRYDMAGNVVWTRQFGTSGYDGGFGVAADGSGVYVTGYVGGALSDQTSAGGQDAFLRAYDLDGSLLWTRQFGTALGDQGTDVTLDESGLYSTGNLSTAGPGDGTSDAFLRKYDRAGNLLWLRRFGTNLDDWSAAVASDGYGVYVTGETWGNLAGQSSVGGIDGFVRRYDQAGDVVWTQQFGSAWQDSPTGIATNGSGLYVAGISWGSSGFDEFIPQFGFLRRYSTTGELEWARRFGEPTSEFGIDSISDVAVDVSEVSVVGRVSGSWPGQATAGDIDAFVRTYNFAGTARGTGQFGSSGFDSLSGVAVDGPGIFVVGQTEATLPGASSVGSGDAFVRRYDTGASPGWRESQSAWQQVQWNTDSEASNACPEVMFIGARGSGQNDSEERGPLNMGSRIESVYRQFAEAVHGLPISGTGFTVASAPVGLEYPAVDAWEVAPFGDYGSSVMTGVIGIAATIAEVDARCGGTTRYVLAGFSQGAQVAADALNAGKGIYAGVPALPRSRVLAVLLLASPYFKRNDCSADLNECVAYFGTFPQRVAQGALTLTGHHPVADWAKGRTAALCNSGDFICTLRGDLFDHASYSSNDLGLLADFAAARVQASITTQVPRCDGIRPTHIARVTAQRIEGTGYADVLLGRGGANLLYGRLGDDRICGGPGDDSLYGGAGNDLLIGDAGTDTAYGQLGTDTCRAEIRAGTCER